MEKTPDKWNINPDYRPSRYVLTGGQRESIASGEKTYSDTDNSDDPEDSQGDNLVEKAQDFPTRIQDILDDIALLSYGGYLSATTWEEIIDIEPRANTLNQENIQFISAERSNSEIQFGFELGTMVKTLQRTADGKTDWSDFIWGVILSHIAERPGKSEDEKENLQELTSELQKMANQRFTLMGYQEAGIDFMLNMLNDDNRIIEQALRENGIEPIKGLVGATKAELRDHGQPITKEIVEDFIQEDLNQGRLTVIGEVYADMTADAERITEEGFPTANISAEEVFQAIWESEDSEDNLNARDISDIIGKAGISNIRGVLNRLSEESEDDLWTRHPVIEMSNNSWKTTNYGSMVGQILFAAHVDPEIPIYNRGRPIDWIYRYALAPERLTAKQQNVVKAMLEEIRPEFN